MSQDCRPLTLTLLPLDFKDTTAHEQRYGSCWVKEWVALDYERKTLNVRVFTYADTASVQAWSDQFEVKP